MNLHTLLGGLVLFVSQLSFPCLTLLFYLDEQVATYPEQLVSPIVSVPFVLRSVVRVREARTTLW